MALVLNYEYSKVSEVKYPLGETIVDAIYTKASIPSDEGNPLIEALPAGLTETQCLQYFYNKNILCDPKADVLTKLDQIDLLDEIRFPLPYVPLVSQQLHSALLRTYRERWKNTKNKIVDITVADEEEVQPIMAKSAGGADSGNGFALIGVSNTGKSETLNRLLLRYPQVIVHESEMGRFTQIVWIKVNAPANGSLDSLYREVGRAIDEVLENTNGTYERLITKQKRIDDKANVISTLIRQFSIGALVFDEIQNLTLEHNKQSSFKSLLSLTNPTKIALIVAGTEQSYHLVFQEYYVARRTEPIRASEYCSDKTRFEQYAKKLMSFQWTIPAVSIAQEMLDSFYNETHGVIGGMITLWKNIQKALVIAESQKKPQTLSASFIAEIAEQKHPFMSIIVKEALDLDNLDEVLESNPDSLATNRLEELKQKESFARTLSKIQDPSKADHIFGEVKKHFLTDNKGICPYNNIKILKEVERVLDMKKYQNADEETLIQAIINRVKKAGSDLRRKSTDTETPVRGFLELKQPEGVT